MSSIFFNELLPDNVRPRLLHTYMYAQSSCRSINFTSTPSHSRLDTLFSKPSRNLAGARTSHLAAYQGSGGLRMGTLDLRPDLQRPGGNCRQVADGRAGAARHRGLPHRTSCHACPGPAG